MQAHEEESGSEYDWDGMRLVNTACIVVNTCLPTRLPAALPDGKGEQLVYSARPNIETLSLARYPGKVKSYRGKGKESWVLYRETENKHREFAGKG